MPPKQKFNKKEIIDAALNLVRKSGITSLTARGLGAELGTSSRPIFTVFSSMDEVREETEKAARVAYNNYIEKGLAENPPFKGVGMQYFRFAKDEPELFGLLFMNESASVSKLADILPAIDDNSDRILFSIQETYGLSKERALKLYQSMWIFTHGIACLSATKTISLSDDETSGLLTEVFTGLLIKMKSEGK